MITLNAINDYLIMLAIAAAGGAVGGLVFELMQARFGQGGMFEIPAKRERGSFYDIGGFASIVVGAVAAVAVLYFFPPTITIDEGDITTTQYDLIQLIALSLIVGSTGGVILQTAQQQVQQRIQAVLSAQQVQTTASVGQTQVQQVGSVAEDAAKAAEKTLDEVVEQINLDKGAMAPVYGALTRLQKDVKHEVKTGQETLSAAAEAPSK